MTSFKITASPSVALVPHIYFNIVSSILSKQQNSKAKVIVKLRGFKYVWTLPSKGSRKKLLVFWFYF